MRRLAVAALFLLAFSACSDEKKEPDYAAEAAKGYYEYLVKGEYERFVNGTQGNKNIPTSYREQLITNVKQFIAQQKTEHQGIKGVETVSSECDSIRQLTTVLLMLRYGDGTKEEIAVPMVEIGGQWLMK